MPGAIPRCEVIPLAENQASFRVDGQEMTRWHFGSRYPRPFLYPIVGPESGASLTRMGHPGASNHDHHRSVWFAHNKLLGIDFWSDNTAARIQQQQWFVYDDSDDMARMAVSLGWFDGHDPEPLVEQELIVTLRPLEDGEYTIDLQSMFQPRADEIEFQQTNFGFLAVRVAKSISAFFGGGHLTNSAGAVGEPDIFGRPAEWMDYSGPVATSTAARETVTEGITYFDHPGNPGFPNCWHVREDGWMGCAPCLQTALVTSRADPLRLRYLLHVHRGTVSSDRADALAAEWSAAPAEHVIRSTQLHRQHEVEPL